MKLFLSNSNKRVYPTAKNGNYKKIYVAQGEIFNYQINVYNDSENLIEATAEVESDFGVKIRCVENIFIKGHTISVPLDETDGPDDYMVPEILAEKEKMEVPPFSTRTFWVRVDTGKSDTLFPLNGNFSDKITVKAKEIKWDNPQEFELTETAEYYVAEFEIKNKKTVPCLHWFYADCISDWYKLPLWSDEFWTMCRKWMENYSAHGNTHIYLPLFTPPLDGYKKPTQLVKVDITDEENKIYSFDFTNAGKWVKLAKECGINKFECVHLFTQWGVEHPIRIYKDTEFNLCPTNVKLYDRDIEIDSEEDRANLVVDIEQSATGEEYSNFLRQFFAAFKAFCEEYGIYDDIMFHVSDEPQDKHLENYKKAYELLKEMKPDIKIMDAMSHIEIAQATGHDMPIADVASAEPFENITHGVYFCCGPRGRYLNRFIDTPLAKTRMLGALMYKKNASFFLHWGYNYYYVHKERELLDPYTDFYGGAYPNLSVGDTFMVYPGENGPLDSIRWENFCDALGDFDLLTNLGTDKKSELFADLKTYGDYPKDPDFIWDLRQKLLENL
ncbi:MAG: DUF4091 domain-containing protein [Armatimonadetes bacterium]|nr:DUF4091 domain-containing protein [Candidatus Hippobium faecium]